MMALTKATQTGNELSTFTYESILEDADETPLTLASIDSATLTLYDATTGNIINSRDAHDIKNANQVTLHATSGQLTWESVALDSPIEGARVPGEKERHIAQFDIVYATTKRLTHELTLYVEALQKLP